MDQSLIIGVLGGSLVKDQKGFWRTTKFTEGDNYGVSGDYLRVYAAYYLAKKNSASLIIILGGWGQLKKIKGAPAVARVIKQELIALGVAKRKILTETTSDRSYHQLLALAKILKKKKIKKISLISNLYHLPRIRALIKYLPVLKKHFLGIQIKYLVAEKVVLEFERSRWQKIIIAAYQSQKMKKRIVLEKKGILDLKRGIYKNYD